MRVGGGVGNVSTASPGQLERRVTVAFLVPGFVVILHTIQAASTVRHKQIDVGRVLIVRSE
jgi:hypothetical protein